MKVEYVVTDCGETYPDDAIEIDAKSWALGEDCAELAAEDFYHNHDGWDVTWPLEFEIYFDGVRQGAYAVDLDWSPDFVARKKP